MECKFFENFQSVPLNINYVVFRKNILQDQNWMGVKTINAFCIKYYMLIEKTGCFQSIVSIIIFLGLCDPLKLITTGTRTSKVIWARARNKPFFIYTYTRTARCYETSGRPEKLVFAGQGRRLSISVRGRWSTGVTSENSWTEIGS